MKEDDNFVIQIVYWVLWTCGFFALLGSIFFDKYFGFNYAAGFIFLVRNLLPFLDFERRRTNINAFEIS